MFASPAAAAQVLGHATSNATVVLQVEVHQPTIQAQAKEWGVPEQDALALIVASKRSRTPAAAASGPPDVLLGDDWKVVSLPDQATLLLLADVPDAPELDIWLAVQRRGQQFFVVSSQSGSADGWVEIPQEHSAFDTWQLDGGLALELEVLPSSGGTVRRRFRDVTP